MREAPQFHVETAILMDRPVKMRRRCEERRHQGEDVPETLLHRDDGDGRGQGAPGLPRAQLPGGPGGVHPLEKHINTGVAVGADAGLVVPVVRDADRMTAPAEPGAQASSGQGTQGLRGA